MKQLWIVLISLSALLTVGCSDDSSSPADTFSAIKSLADSDLMETLESADEDFYDAPTDGKLTEKQVMMYLEIVRKEKVLQKENLHSIKQSVDSVEAIEGNEQTISNQIKSLSALQGVGEFLLLDIKAAESLGYNTAEYQWVKETLLNTEVEMEKADNDKQLINAVQTDIAQLKAERAGASAAEQELIDYQIKSLEEMVLDVRGDVDGTVLEMNAHNAALLAKYDDEINVMEHELSRFSQLEAEE